MTDTHYIADAMELYGESAVSDVIARNGNYYEIITLFDIEAGMKLLKISKFETTDGKIFRRKRTSSVRSGDN